MLLLAGRSAASSWTSTAGPVLIQQRLSPLFTTTADSTSSMLSSTAMPASAANLQHHFVLPPPPCPARAPAPILPPQVTAPASQRPHHHHHHYARQPRTALAAAASPLPGRDPTPGAVRPLTSSSSALPALGGGLPMILSPPTTSTALPATPGVPAPGSGSSVRGVAAAAAPSEGVPSSLAWQVQRTVSEHPQGSVYTGPAPPSPRRVTLRTLRQKYQKGEPITMVTAYDYPSAVHVDEAGIDIALVGDSVAMVVHGHDTTLPISMEEMLVHCRAAARGAKRAFMIGDMPFGSYETGVRDAVINAMRMLKEGGMDAVKLEGGSPARVEAARAIVEAGVAVMGHVGLTPQSVSVLGGFRPQAQVADEALAVLAQAQALQKAGCFALVLECVPAPIAAAVTASVDIPTIGIGAGSATSGQVLVYHDLLGMMSHPHHAKVTPKFCKQYAHVGGVIQTALQQYRDEVVSGAFPSARFSPYRIPEQELDVLVDALRQRGAHTAAQAVQEVAQRDGQQVAAAAAAQAAGTASAPPPQPPLAAHAGSGAVPSPAV